MRHGLRVRTAGSCRGCTLKAGEASVAVVELVAFDKENDDPEIARRFQISRTKLYTARYITLDAYKADGGRKG
jgi:hypothetical protein